MSTVETIPDKVIRQQWPEPPRLLVEWSSPWQEFKTALRPALSKSPKHLAGEAPVGMFPYRGMLLTLTLEALLLFMAIAGTARMESMRPYTPPPMQKWDIVYYSGDELPKTEDAGGALAGKSGRAGGQEAHHRTQTIRVARGSTPTEKVVDAPKVNLPRSESSVANLLAFKPVPGPPPAEGMRSTFAAPALPTPTVVAPSPELDSGLTRKTENLTASIITPAPEVSRANLRSLPTVNAPVVAPAPEIKRDQMRTTNAIAPSVVAPAPSDAQRDLASSRSNLTQMTSVVAPPVSSPMRETSNRPKLALPAPTVVAPPPSEVNRDLNSWGGSAVGNPRAAPVPPPPSVAGAGTLSRSAPGGLSTQVVPPPVSADSGLKGNSGTRNGGSLLGATEVVPPPPSLGGGASLSGSGRGNKGLGTGSPADAGVALAPPGASGGAAGSAVVVSNQPGTKVGVPNASSGAIAMSPTGAAKAGLGGNGGGAGLGKGNGPGSGLQGENSGAGKEGAGPGSDPNSKSGISPYPGTGGAGSGTSGAPAMPGVSVRGGNTITLPSFGSAGAAVASGPGHSSANDHKRSGITVSCTSSSCGVLPYYGRLKGDNYSIYIETSLGTAVMQYADSSAAAHATGVPLIEPDPIRKDLPAGLRPTRVVIACVLSREGSLKDIRVLEPGSAESTSKILAALPAWKFRPALRGNDPVEINAIIGFGIDTR
jgi:hypothetical protein